VIADNKLSLSASWDLEMLRLELTDLNAAGFDLDLTGFTADDLLSVLVEDEAPSDTEPESSSREVDVDEYKMEHTCPKCGFEFDEKT
jgi:hypothetical protein